MALNDCKIIELPKSPTREVTFLLLKAGNIYPSIYNGFITSTMFPVDQIVDLMHIKTCISSLLPCRVALMLFWTTDTKNNDFTLTALLWIIYLPNDVAVFGQFLIRCRVYGACISPL